MRYFRKRGSTMPNMFGREFMEFMFVRFHDEGRPETHAEVVFENGAIQVHPGFRIEDMTSGQHQAWESVPEPDAIEVIRLKCAGTLLSDLEKKASEQTPIDLSPGPPVNVHNDWRTFPFNQQNPHCITGPEDTKSVNKPAVIPPAGITAHWVSGPGDTKPVNEKPTADQLEQAARFLSGIVKSRAEKATTDQADVLAVQHGGNHYKGMKIQPVEYAKANDLDCLQFSVVKYITRHRLKAGAEDLKKCIHFAQMALKMDYGVDSKVEYSEEKKAGN